MGDYESKHDVATTHNLVQEKALPHREDMAGVNTEAVKSLDFIVKAVLWLVLLITMAMVTSNNVCSVHPKIGHLLELSTLGFFFFYLLQIATLLGGEKIPCTMGILTAVFGAIFNFCCAVVIIKDGRGSFCSLTTLYDTTMTYGAFSLIAIPLFVIDAGLAFKNKSS